jgi:hypothetical protein
MISDRPEKKIETKTRILVAKTHLVRRRDQGANQTSNDHNFIEEDEGDDVGQRQTSGEDELQEKGRGGNNPVDVSDIPNGTRESLCLPVELDEDGGTTEVRCHTAELSVLPNETALENSREVGNRCSSQNQNSQVVECPPSFRQREHPSHEQQIGEEHDGEDRP